MYSSTWNLYLRHSTQSHRVLVSCTTSRDEDATLTWLPRSDQNFYYSCHHSKPCLNDSSTWRGWIWLRAKWTGRRFMIIAPLTTALNDWSSLLTASSRQYLDTSSRRNSHQYWISGSLLWLDSCLFLFSLSLGNIPCHRDNNWWLHELMEWEFTMSRFYPTLLDLPRYRHLPTTVYAAASQLTTLSPWWPALHVHVLRRRTWCSVVKIRWRSEEFVCRRLEFELGWLIE